VKALPQTGDAGMMAMPLAAGFMSASAAAFAARRRRNRK
jgi:LPXTG-motif cell wall-anchored protein